jgi:hypothetical protein
VQIQWGTAGFAALSARIKGQWRNDVRNGHPRDGNHIARDLTVYEARLRRPLPRHRANRGLVNL